MARLRRLVLTGEAFFITTNLKRGLPVFTPRERDLLCQTIAEVRRRRRFRLAGFVVMPDHIHLLILPDLEDTISAVVKELKYVTGRTINDTRQRKGTLWQKGFFDRFMRTPKEFGETLEYMHENPVRKGLVAEPRDWRWSSVAAYAGGACIISVDFIDLPAQTEKRFR